MKLLHALPILALVLCMTKVNAQTDDDFWLAFEVNTPPPAIDHEPFNNLLRAHSTADSHPIWRHRFDPSDFSRKEKSQLKDYIEAMEGIDPRYHSYDEQLAYWVNLYNAITVSFLIDAKDFNQISDHREEQVIEVAGKRLSQREIAENVLMPVWNDSSLHFLLSCGALDCPPVPHEAAKPKTIHKQANPAMQAYMNGPEGLKLENGTLYLPKAFEYFSTYYDSPNAMLKKLAFSVSDSLAIKLLGHAGPIVYSDEMTLASP